MAKNSNDLILKGPPLDEPLSEKSLGIILYESLSRNSDKVLFLQVETNERVTYGKYLENTCKLAEALKNTGFRQNDVAAVCCGNNLVFFEPIIACLYLGMTMSPISNTYTENEILHIVNLSRPKVIFCSRTVVEKFVSIQQKCPYLRKIIVMDSKEEIPHAESMERFRNTNAADGKSFKPVNVNIEEEIAVVLCSSGTTGLPKGVMLTHYNINFRLKHCGDPKIHVIEGDAKIAVLPFYHSYGFTMAIGSIAYGETIVVFSKFKEELFYKTIQKYKISELWVTPPILVMMSKSALALRYDFSSVGCCICGGAPLSKSVEDNLMDRLKLSVRQGYGSTETTLAAVLMPRGIEKRGSAGKVVPGMYCKIQDPATGKLLGPRQIGEVYVKGGLVAKGYINDPKATRESFDEDGWFRTGDIAYYDDEGFFYIVDRLKELIKYRGFQVAPAELEALLLKHPKIKDVTVIGLPEELAGELPLAFVVKQDGATLTAEEVKKYVEQNISRTKWLHGGIFFLKAIPKNPTGKILRKELRNFLKSLNIRAKL